MYKAHFSDTTFFMQNFRNRLSFSSYKIVP
nr:MAG TPA: hypothetical protein [Caudoviricetes sp.]